MCLFYCGVYCCGIEGSGVDVFEVVEEVVYWGVDGVDDDDWIFVGYGIFFLY